MYKLCICIGNSIFEVFLAEVPFAYCYILQLSNRECSAKINTQTHFTYIILSSALLYLPFSLACNAWINFWYIYLYIEESLFLISWFNCTVQETIFSIYTRHISTPIPIHQEQTNVQNKYTKIDWHQINDWTTA